MSHAFVAGVVRMAAGDATTALAASGRAACSTTTRTSGSLRALSARTVSLAGCCDAALGTIRLVAASAIVTCQRQEQIRRTRSAPAFDDVDMVIPGRATASAQGSRK